ncbi:hypothetical protein Mar181_3251 [Marinomonas posidonica IVIA-Po-181]|uniref:Uncharacterized protein n=1 Tax=Marinomonas posidonica (strain CECT 7376 / NCIMB 14433 / IVIA-Po-181) TaxID=491952 RepID=F6CTA7_MARPP|nr:hypothetical protein Mar181_3251 [Marinomonas posidonica IVIA-Po-181]
MRRNRLKNKQKQPCNKKKATLNLSRVASVNQTILIIGVFTVQFVLASFQVALEARHT